MAAAAILPNLTKVKTFGNIENRSFWTEYPSGLIDLTRNHPPTSVVTTGSEPSKEGNELEFEVDGDRRVRVDPKQSAIVIVDMQKNWGLTPRELTTLPPVLVRSFTKLGEGGFGCDLGGNWGPALMRGTPNADLYGPLKDEWLKGKEAGTDIWFHKNRVGGLWGPGTPLGLYLREEGLNTLFFAGVNTDQCVLGTLVDAYFNGYDSILIKDATATTSPDHGYDGALYNTELLYGFVTDSQKIITGAAR
ncbi:hypothetical protein Clacol_007038 [Clathrus columnatus]|uniref:Isochorismatase-like domain-containing protein n=1 Tax=Clathrus columnatus TaxID=1419009 RepID=A0AAV5AJE0_9AGAM|nr:hypothetical protein Clacol_007038 [Clathrus columnatus]